MVEFICNFCGSKFQTNREKPHCPGCLGDDVQPNWPERDTQMDGDLEE